MNCSNCGQTLTAADAFCPACGTSQAGAPRITNPPREQSAAQVPPYRFDPKRWSTTDRIAGVASIVVFIALFLPWFSASADSITSTESGLQAHGYLYIPLILVIIEVLYLFAGAGWAEVKNRTPLPSGLLLTIVNVVTLVFIVVGFLDKPQANYAGAGVSWSYGAFAALAAAAVAAGPNIVLSLVERARKG